jgi:hypothetical protein
MTAPIEANGSAAGARGGAALTEQSMNPGRGHLQGKNRLW